jgi:hypothetical protein
MTTFTIDTDNNITAYDAMPAAQGNLVVFASQKELAKVTAVWPANRLVEIWNSFDGLAEAHRPRVHLDAH